METWKLVLVVGLAVLAIGLEVASAYAAVVRPAAASYGAYNGVANPNGGYASGMMRGGMMEGFRSQPYYNGYGYSYGASNGFGGCMGSRGWP